MSVPLLSKLKQSKTASGSVWVTLQTGLSQLIRLGGNLVLTRLLVPEYFGLMSLIMTIQAFFQMLSDVGLIPSIINSKRDKDPAFMQTAWTIQVLRSSLISVCVLLFAYPASRIYEEPILFPLLAVLAFCSIFEGFYSTALIIEQKHLRQRKRVIADLSSQVISMFAIIWLAFFFRSVWILIAGHLIRILCMLIASYIFFAPHFSKFRLEKEAVHEIMHFGKWILLASFFGYFAVRGDALVMGIILSMDQLGIYVIATTFASLMDIIANRLSDTVLQPRYRQLILANKGFEALYRLRLNFSLIFIGTSILLALLGNLLIRGLYDSRYEEAGWILQILALGRIFSILSHHSRPILISMGDSKNLMFNQIIAAITVIPFLVIGNNLGGFEGMILAHASSPLIGYVSLAYFLKKHDISIIHQDILLILASFLTVITAWYFIGAKPITIILSLFNQVSA